ncbi:MAG: 4Fe-4S dicluster domain-containing protein [Deltaproteobacteria bacterium]|nr:4Fe-4S dicluster domain-containing protein [Deltaproteobacteria bacterium]
MVFTVSLYLALVVFAAGTFYKVAAWFTRKVGVFGQGFTPARRVGAAVRGILGVLFSVKVFFLIRTFILDVLLQVRIVKEDPLRWIMHLLIYGGFILLLLMHALEDHITVALFPDYYSTLSPFFVLRDIFGLMVIVGVGIAVYRRFILKVPRMRTNAMDRYAIIILAVIMLSGFLLEGAKMTSHTEFMRMVYDYAGMDDEEEIKALESFWVAEYGTVSPNVQGPFEEEVLEEGSEINFVNCAGCHAPNKSAFVGYATAKALSPVALVLDRADGTTVLWYIHIFACFFGLAYLPFSKMFHIFSSSVSLMANAVMDPKKSLPENIATRQAMELDACMHCATCSLRCSVSVAYEAKGNPMILPGEKMQFLKAYAAGKPLSKEAMAAIGEGIYLCTNCDRCTVVCPAGINLRDLWLSVRDQILAQDAPVFLTLSPFSLFRGLNRHRLPAEGYDRPLQAARDAMEEAFPMVQDTEAVIPVTPVNADFKANAVSTPPGATFAYCFSCENCTTVCPVVEAYENPQTAVGLLPHQIMRSLGLGLRDLALGAPMLWNCLTCYQCQEHCPQGVKVTDILYELKNAAVKEAAVGA